jgi:hypothetical protein
MAAHDVHFGWSPPRNSALGGSTSVAEGSQSTATAADVADVADVGVGFRAAVGAGAGAGECVGEAAHS